MKQFRFTALLIGSLALAGLAFAGGKTVTQKYEVVCLKCVAHNAAMGKDGGHGAGHAACAMKCAMNGTDLGVMDSKGNLYSVINADFSSGREAIKDKAGQMVELTGFIVKTKGINYLQLAAPMDKDGMGMSKSDGDKD